MSVAKCYDCDKIKSYTCAIYFVLYLHLYIYLKYCIGQFHLRYASEYYCVCVLFQITAMDVFANKSKGTVQYYVKFI